MAKRGTRKYRCGECGEAQFKHWVERNRAKRLTCIACGSARMELTSDEAKRDAARLGDIVVGGGTPSAPRQEIKPG